MAGWQSGHAAACKAVYAGSIPASASINKPPLIKMKFIKKSDIFLVGEMIVLELFQDTDITEEYIAWLNDPEVVKFSNQRFISHNLESSKIFFDSFFNSPNYFLKISEKNSMTPIGTMTLYVNPNHCTADIGVLIGNTNYWNGGFGFDAWNTCMNWALKELNIRKITAGTLSSNVGMQRIMEKSGMKLEGRKIKQEIVDGKEEDILFFAKFQS